MIFFFSGFSVGSYKWRRVLACLWSVTMLCYHARYMMLTPIGSCKQNSTSVVFICCANSSLSYLHPVSPIKFVLKVCLKDWQLIMTSWQALQMLLTFQLLNEHLYIWIAFGQQIQSHCHNSLLTFYLFQNSFFPSRIRLWNTLYVPCTQSLSHFKQAVCIYYLFANSNLPI